MPRRAFHARCTDGFIPKTVQYHLAISISRLTAVSSTANRVSITIAYDCVILWMQEKKEVSVAPTPYCKRGLYGWDWHCWFNCSQGKLKIGETQYQGWQTEYWETSWIGKLRAFSLNSRSEPLLSPLSILRYDTVVSQIYRVGVVCQWLSEFASEMVLDAKYQLYFVVCLIFLS